MNWDALGALAELFGAAAVFATLVYLSLQVRHARDDIQRSVQQARSNGFRELMNARFMNKDWNDAFIKAGNAYQPGMTKPKELADAAGLSPYEMNLLWNDNMSFWVYRCDVIENIDLLPANQKISFDRGVMLTYSRGYGAIWYQNYRLSQPDDPAVVYVDRVLAGETGLYFDLSGVLVAGDGERSA